MKATPKTWIVMGGGPNELAHCTRCGVGLSLPLPQPISVFAAAAKAFEKSHAKCKPGEFVERVPASIHAWATGRDTGTSSLTIYSAVTGSPIPDKDVPHDPADFGRCYRLLKAFPEIMPTFRRRIAEVCPAWRPLVDAWDELTALYEEELPSGSGPKLWKRMRELMGEKPVDC